MQTKKITSIIIISAIIVCAIILGITYFFNSGDAPQEEELSTVAIVTTESGTEISTSSIEDGPAVSETGPADSSEDGPAESSDVSPADDKQSDSAVFEPAIAVDATTTEKPESEEEQAQYTFRNKYRLDEHYEKHGKDMGFEDAKSYEKAASDVINDPRALHKTEAEDGDDVYYIEETNDFVILSSDGYIRTYFWPNDGIKYYKRQ